MRPPARPPARRGRARPARSRARPAPRPPCARCCSRAAWRRNARPREQRAPTPRRPPSPPPTPPPRYGALRRKIGGTAKDFFKSWVEEEQVKNIKTYYKPEEANGTVPYLPFLVAVVLGMLATTAAVVAQTS